MDNSSHLSEKDKAPLLEYPLNRVGSKFPTIIQSSVLSSINESASTAPSVPRECCGSADTPQSGASYGQLSSSCAINKMISRESEESATDSEDECEHQPAKRVKLIEEVDHGEAKRGGGKKGERVGLTGGRGTVEVWSGESSEQEGCSLLQGNKEVSWRGHIVVRVSFGRVLLEA